MIGKKVQMKVSNAKWYLDHPDIYEIFGKIECVEEFDIETQIHLMCGLGVPVTGKVLSKGNGCWLVQWSVAALRATYYIDRKNFTVIDG